MSGANLAGARMVSDQNKAQNKPCPQALVLEVSTPNAISHTFKVMTYCDPMLSAILEKLDNIRTKQQCNC